MTTGTQNVGINVAIDIDRPAARRVEQASQRVIDAFSKLQKKALELDSGLARSKGYASAVEASKEAEQQLGRLKNEVTNTRKELDRLDREMGSARGADKFEARIKEAAESTELFGDVGSRTRDIGGGIAAVGGIGGQAIERRLFIASDLLDATEGLGRMKAELPALTSRLIESAGGVGKLSLGLGAAGLATGALILAYKGLSEESQRAARGTQAWLTALQQYYQINPSRLTTEQLEEEIRARRDLGSQLSYEAAAVATRIEGLEDEQGALEFLADKAGLFDDELETLRTRYGELTDVISANIDVQDMLQNALDTGVSSSGDYAASIEKIAEAERELAEQRAQISAAIIADVRSETAARLEEQSRLTEWTIDQTNARLEENAREQNAVIAENERLRALYDEGRITREALNAATVENSAALSDLVQEFVSLNSVVLPAAAARDAETKAIEDSKAALEERKQAIEDERKAMEARRAALEKFIEDSIKLEQDRARDLVEEAADFALKQVRDRAKHYSELAKLDEQFYSKRADLLESITDISAEAVQERLDELKDYNRESERAAEDHQKTLLQIQRSAERDIASAAMQLDAVAIREAQIRSEDELDAENDQYRTEQRNREEDYRERIQLLEREKSARLQDARDRLRELEDSHRVERSERIQAYQRKQQEEIADHNLSLQRQREAWAREDSERRVALARQLGIETDSLNAILNTAQAKWGQLETLYASHFSNLIALVEREFGRMSRTAMSAVIDAINNSPYRDQRLGGPQVPDFADFGTMPYRGLAQLERGEVALGTQLSSFVHNAFGGSLNEATLGAAIARGVGGGGSGGGNTYNITVPGAGDPGAVAQAVYNVIMDMDMAG